MSEAEYAAAYQLMNPMTQCAMDLAVLTALRPGDLLALTRANLTDDGFNTIFYRAMGKAIKDENSGLRERFQFRDLRAKSASDDTAEAASKRLGHADPKITERIYRRKAERAKPLR